MDSTLLTLLLLVVGAASIAINHRQRFAGQDFCKTRRAVNGQLEQCCANRNDLCTVPILDTVCYCDIFCGIHHVEDCCPDFNATTCAGNYVPKPTTRRPVERNRCFDGGRRYYYGETVNKADSDCNKCTCEQRYDGLYWDCTEKVCINEEVLVNRINKRSGWEATTYPKFKGVTVEKGKGYYLGTDLPTSQVAKLHPIDTNLKIENFNETFNSINAFEPGYIHEAMDQGRCGASWAFSTASVAADRWSIQSNGAFINDISVQQMISCSEDSNYVSDGCTGAGVEIGWFYLRYQGAVAEECYRYTRQNGTGNQRKGQCLPLSEMSCRDNHVHKTSPIHRIAPDEKEIMKEIENQGPVQAIMKVYADFYLYKSGVYEHSRAESSNIEGTHSVKIIGWGKEKNTKYWLCVNSWGKEWGDNGMFKIKRGTNECDIENFVIGVLASVESHDLPDYQSRRHRRHRRYK